MRFDSAFEYHLHAEHERAERERRRRDNALTVWPPPPAWPVAANTTYRIRLTLNWPIPPPSRDALITAFAEIGRAVYRAADAMATVLDDLAVTLREAFARMSSPAAATRGGLCFTFENETRELPATAAEPWIKHVSTGRHRFTCNSGCGGYDTGMLGGRPAVWLAAQLHMRDEHLDLFEEWLKVTPSMVGATCRRHSAGGSWWA